MGNLSLCCLSIKAVLSQSPALSSYGSVMCGNSRISFTFSPLIYNPKRFSASKNEFENFLNSVLVSLDSYTLTNIVTSASYTSGPVSFYHCVFSNCSSTSTGGAVSCSFSTVANFSIIECLFTNCTSSGNGGAIYSSKANLTISKTCFTKCYSKIHTDNNGGDALYHTNAYISATLVTAYLCAPTTALGSDSLIWIVSSSANISNINSTYCNGDGNGASLGSFWYISSPSTFQFLNVKNGNEREAFESNYDDTTFSYMNIYNNTVSYDVIQAISETLTVKYSFIYGNSLTSTYLNSATLTLVGCWGDLSNSQITATATVSFASGSYIPMKKCNFAATNIFSEVKSAFSIIPCTSFATVLITELNE